MARGTLDMGVIREAWGPRRLIEISVEGVGLSFDSLSGMASNSTARAAFIASGASADE